MQIKVQIDGKTYDLDVYQTRPTVWEAGGDFEGRPVSVKGSSRRNVISRWCSVAPRQGD